MYKLSKTGKMPGKSFAIPASTCKVGSKLACKSGSVCASCYARKGSYHYPNVKNVRNDNFERWASQVGTTDFREELKTLIEAEYLKTGVPYFRWFDSGDLQTEEMFIDIIWIALQLPKIKFWLPTKEVGIVKSVMEELGELPSNLSVRISAYMVDGEYHNLPECMRHCSQTRVISSEDTKKSFETICSGQCVSCNYKCWNSMLSIAYIKH